MILVLITYLEILTIWSNIHLAHRAWLVFCIESFTNTIIGLLLPRYALGEAMCPIMDTLHAVHSRSGV